MASSKSLQEGQFPSSCKLCDMKIQLSWKCMDCDILMCNRCKDKIHPNLRNAKNHKVIDIKEVGLTTKEVDFINIPCKEHKVQVCVMFCKSCNQLVCTKCIAKVHNGHGLVEISEGYEIQIERLNDRHNKMKINTDKLATDKSKIKDIKKAENAKYVEVKKQIITHNILLKKALDQYTENLLKELDQKWEALLNSIEKEESKVITLEKNALDRNIEYIIQSGDIERIFEMGKDLDISLEEEHIPLEYNFTSLPSFKTGEYSRYNVGTLQDTPTDITLQVIKEYTTDISTVLFMSPCVDSLWISSNEVVQNVQPEVNDLKLISSFDIEVNDMAITPSNDLLIAPFRESALRQISVSTNEITDTIYSVDPLCLTALHVTSDGEVVVGAKNFGKTFPATGRRVIIAMDKKGKHRTVYEYDSNNQPIFTYPWSITSTYNGNICVVDSLSSDDRGRVVVIGPTEDILNIYTGHPDINSEDDPFKPASVATTPSDNIIVTNMNTDVLHILNNVGHLVTHIDTKNIGIECPYSITFTTKGKVYIGCSNEHSSTDNCKLYEVKLLE